MYISHDFCGDNKNKQRIKDIVKVLTQIYPDKIFISPIHAFGFLYEDLYENVEQQQLLNMCLKLLSVCDNMIVCDNYEDSINVQSEIDFCINHNIPYECIDERIMTKLIKDNLKGGEHYIY